MPGHKQPAWMDIKRIPYKAGAAVFRDALQKRERFESNSMHAHPVKISPLDRTVRSWIGSLDTRTPEAAGLKDADYLITSYGTPIAWHSKSKGWECPKITYSSTTSHQQGIIRAAIALMGYRPCHPRICPARTGQITECICIGDTWDMPYFEPQHEGTEMPAKANDRKHWRLAS